VKFAVDLTDNVFGFQLDKAVPDAPEGSGDAFTNLTALLKKNQDIDQERFEKLEGGFYRDLGQMEKDYRLSARIDDTAICVSALLRARAMLAGMKVVGKKGDL